jgi:hypothetical protein
MKKTALLAVLFLLLFSAISAPVKAGTVLTGTWVEFSFTTCTVDNEYQRTGDYLVRFRSEGLDSMTFRLENVGNGEKILIAEYEIPGSEEGESDIRPEDYPLRDYLVTVEGKKDGETLVCSVIFYPPDEVVKEPRDPDGDLTPPSVSINPVADRMLVNVSDADGLYAIGSSLAYADLPGREFGGFYTPGFDGQKAATHVSDSVLYNGTWVYTFCAYDRNGNMTARTVFFETSGLEDMPDAVRFPETEIPQTTAPNTSDPAVILLWSTVLTGASLLLRRKKS